ncbi:pimeloyl-ACP methyl ester carboxylesterase [Streptomyces sp. B3I7]|uniref:alpha/beta hydrolase n=1 Tax=Streptomyces sp. B3I7 TaxID=3042269 RepID=UPI00278974A2|nr:alpha/beta hydrolase [Streptomyces sp. B3I7]MDQ0814924.1 pimeloyl-ACP methyl ester carboxylesterase [Streptomyces sp. B3I7]
MLPMFGCRPAAAAVTATALALLVPGGAPAAAPETGPAATHATTPRATAPDLSRFYRQRVVWSACEGDGMPADLQCGKVTVPLDYAHPAGGTLDLALARYRASGPSRGSVLLNFGGPGGPGVPQLALGGKDFMGLTDGYDVVTFDPRGVGRSSPVSCGEGTDRMLAATEDGAVERNPRAALETLRAAAAQCVAHSGPVLRHIGTVNAARDLDVMRQALGDDRLDYLGFSYGTRLGAVYAAQFPKKVGRMVFDGVDTLTESPDEQGVVSAAGQQRALEDFLARCAEDIACPFGQDARAAREQMVRLVRSLDEEPLPTDFGGTFTGQDLVAAVGQGLYSEQFWPALEQALADLIQSGDAGRLTGFTGGGTVVPPRDDRPAATAPGSAVPTTGPIAVEPPGPGRVPGYADLTGSGPAHKDGPRTGPSPAAGASRADGGLVDPEDVPVDNLPAALMAVNCADDPDRRTAAQVVGDLGRLRARYEEASPVFGRYRLSEVLMCYGRPRGTDFVREKVRDVPAPKMLLVGTRGDPATPYRWTVETAKRLGPSAVVLDNRGEGHTGYATSPCVHRKVDAFLLYGTTPPDGSSCGPEREG